MKRPSSDLETRNALASSEKFSSSLLDESLSESSRMTRVFFLEDVSFRLLYLRYFVFCCEASFSSRLISLDFFLRSLFENFGFSLPLDFRTLHSREV